jgi:hypothetical protein
MKYSKVDHFENSINEGGTPESTLIDATVENGFDPVSYCQPINFDI